MKRKISQVTFLSARSLVFTIPLFAQVAGSQVEFFVDSFTVKSLPDGGRLLPFNCVTTMGKMLRESQSR